MRGSTSNVRRERATRVLYACTVVMAMLVAGVASVGVTAETADARGPEYSGEQTTGDGPAYFGPAPNPFPYCDSPTYFDPFPENIAPIGRMDVGDTASVTTNGLTMDLVITAEGNPGTQYPGFFPNGADGGSNDRAKGIELAEGDTAVVSLSAPLFYSQWIFTDVDQPNEGFTVTPTWTIPGQAAVFAGDTEWTFAGTSPFGVELDDTNGVSEVSESINGRGQVDFLGAVTGITMERTNPSNGQSGFAVGGGCEAAGAAKVVVAGPTWNGSSFDVTYELRVRNNLPSSATIQSVIDDAVAEVGASLVTGSPQGIALSGLQLTDNLSNDGFTDIQVTSRSTDGGLVLNQNFDGINDLDLISSGEIAAEENEVITLSVQYTPDFAQAVWAECAAGYNLLNQTELTASAANVGVSDLSDNGISARPGDNNGEGGVDDPTPVRFPCPPGGLEIVKTVVPGPNGTCPAFDAGVVGDGPALPVTVDDVVTYCVSVRNPGPGPITNVVVADAQAPGDISLNDLFAGQTDTTSYDVTVALTTPTLNTATATADDVDGPVPPASDSAVIEPAAKPQPLLEIVKTVVVGPNGACPSFVNGVADLGPALAVDDGDTVTYCISVRNSGQGDALKVIITDAQAPQDYSIGTLAPGAGRTVSYDLTVGLDTATVNVASGTYSGPDGPLDPVDDDAQIEVSPLQPDLEIVKTVLLGADASCPAFDQGVTGIGPALSVDDGGTVTYCISIRNSGLGVANGVVINDAQAPAAFTIGTLAAGQTETVQYNVTVDLTTPIDNIATATGVGPYGDLDPVSDPARIGVDALPDPVLEIVKTALRGPDAICPDFDGGVAGPGDPVNFVETETVTYCITVRNTGVGTATNVRVTDPQAPDSFDLNIGTLASGESETRSYDLVVDTQTPATNVATVNGTGPNGTLDPQSDPAIISVSLQPDPILEIVKTVVPGPDGDCPATFDEGIAGQGDALGVTFGDAVTYCITVRNVGGNDATGVTVADQQAPGVLQLGVVAVGQEVSESYDVVVDATTPLVNTATVNGNGPNGPVPSNSDDAVINSAPEPDPVLDIVKTVVLGPDGSCPSFADGVPGPGDALTVVAGQTVTYCIAIQNTGVGDAVNVQISDDQAPESPIQIGSLPAGEGRLVQYDLLVNDNSGLRNLAILTGDGPNGPADPAEDDAIIDTRSASISLIHSVSKANEDCETVAKNLNSLVANIEELPITWCALITNNGNVPLTNVVLEAPAIGNGDPIDVLATTGSSVLLPGQSVVIPVAGEIPDTGLISNALVEADPSDADGNVLADVTPPSDVDNAEVREASIEIETTVAAGADADCDEAVEVLLIPSGEDITWCFAVTNTGAVDLLVAQVVDPNLDITASVPANQQRLPPNVTIFLQANGESADGIEIIADVKGRPLDFDGTILDQAPEVEDLDPAQVVVPVSDVQIVKSNSNAGPVSIGDTITYSLVITNNGPNRARQVEVFDQLPVGISYESLPGDPDWACSLDDDEAGFSCLKATNLAAGVSVTLTYTAQINEQAPDATQLTNTATVTTITPDGDPTNNEDTSTTETDTPDIVTPTPTPTPRPTPRPTPPPGIQYPGPFDPPAATVVTPPDEVLGLAITGASSNLLGLLATALLATGGLLAVGARRSRRDD